MGNLYIVATPIGNLADISYRAVEVLADVTCIYAEDTRVSKRLLDHYNIETPLKGFNEHSGDKVYKEIQSKLEKGESVALVSDAGTPSVADPGARLIAYLLEKIPDLKVVPIPGPSAVTTAVSVSGIGTEHFSFLGFPPHKKGRETFFNNLAKINIRPIIFYESPHRIINALERMSETLNKDQQIVIARELTKIHEEIFRGTPVEALNHFSTGEHRGEFVIIIA